jgi:hypothetical protein
MLFHKWVLNCIGFLATDAPEHVTQIKAVHKPDIALHHQAVQIFAILSSAVEVLRSNKEKLSRKTVSEKPPTAFSLEFVAPKLAEKCSDHFYGAKYDDCILNAAKVVEVIVREAAGLPLEEVGGEFNAKGFQASSTDIEIQ